MELTTLFGLPSLAHQLVDRRPSLAARTEWARHPLWTARMRELQDKTNLLAMGHTYRNLLFASGFGTRFLPIHSPLLREILLVSFPQFSNKHYFSGPSRSSRERQCWFCDPLTNRNIFQRQIRILKCYLAFKITYFYLDNIQLRGFR